MASRPSKNVEEGTNERYLHLRIQKKSFNDSSQDNARGSRELKKGNIEDLKFEKGNQSKPADPGRRA
jgi:hypothetical protein